MNCPHCGSTAVQPSGTCSSCGRSVNASSDPTALHYPPPVDPFATGAPLTGPDPLAPYPPPADQYPSPAQSTSGQPFSGQPTPGHPTSGQPFSGQPFSGQPFSGQPAPGQPFSGQPTSGQPNPPLPYPGQQPPPYPGQPQPYSGQPYTGQQQPYPTQGYGGAQPNQGYGAPQPPYYGPNPYAQTQQSAGQGFSITAFVLAAIAVFFVPVVFGLGAIIFASVARRRGEQHAQLAMRLAVAGTLLGFFFGYLIRFL
jgi:hypothetical protein